MKRTQELAVESPTYSFYSIPDEIKLDIVRDTWHRRIGLVNPPIIAQTIASLRQTSKSFNKLLSDANVALLVTINEKNRDQLLYKYARTRAPLLVNIAINAGANVNCYNEEHLLTPLLVATHNDDFITCKLLVSKGANVNASNNNTKKADKQLKWNKPHRLIDRYFPIHIATENDNAKIVKLFIEAGADVNKERLEKQRPDIPLFTAIQNDSVNLVKLLLPSTNPRLFSSLYFEETEEIDFFRTPLDLALSKGNKEIIDLLYNQLLYVTK